VIIKVYSGLGVMEYPAEKAEDHNDGSRPGSNVLQTTVIRRQTGVFRLFH